MEKEWKREPNQVLESRFSLLILYDRPVRVIKKASNTDINTLHDALSSLDPTYNQDIRENSRFVMEMPILHHFCAEHTVFTPYSLRWKIYLQKSWLFSDKITARRKGLSASISSNSAT